MVEPIEGIEEISDLGEHRKAIEKQAYEAIYQNLPTLPPPIISSSILKERGTTTLTPLSKSIPPQTEKEGGVSSLFKPRIKKPSVEYEIVASCRDIAESYKEDGLTSRHAIDELREKHKALDLQLQELQSKASLESENQESWTAFGRIASFLAASSSFVLGLSLLSTGAGGAAYFLVASGGLGLINELFQGAGWEQVAAFFTDDEEKQKKTAFYLHHAMLALSLGLGLYGLGMGYHGAIFSLAQLSKVEQVVKVVNLTSLFARTVVQGMQAYIQYKIENYESPSFAIRAEKSVLDNSMKQLVESIQESHDRSQEIQRVGRFIISTHDI